MEKDRRTPKLFGSRISSIFNPHTNPNAAEVKSSLLSPQSTRKAASSASGTSASASSSTAASGPGGGSASAPSSSNTAAGGTSSRLEPTTPKRTSFMPTRTPGSATSPAVHRRAGVSPSPQPLASGGGHSSSNRHSTQSNTTSASLASDGSMSVLRPMSAIPDHLLPHMAAQQASPQQQQQQQQYGSSLHPSQGVNPHHNQTSLAQQLYGTPEGAAGTTGGHSAATAAAAGLAPQSPGGHKPHRKPPPSLEMPHETRAAAATATSKDRITSLDSIVTTPPHAGGGHRATASNDLSDIIGSLENDIQLLSPGEHNHEYQEDIDFIDDIDPLNVSRLGKAGSPSPQMPSGSGFEDENPFLFGQHHNNSTRETFDTADSSSVGARRVGGGRGGSSSGNSNRSPSTDSYHTFRVSADQRQHGGGGGSNSGGGPTSSSSVGAAAASSIASQRQSLAHSNHSQAQSSASQLGADSFDSSSEYDSSTRNTSGTPAGAASSSGAGSTNLLQQHDTPSIGSGSGASSTGYGALLGGGGNFHSSGGGGVVPFDAPYPVSPDEDTFSLAYHPINGVSQSSSGYNSESPTSGGGGFHAIHGGGAPPVGYGAAAAAGTAAGAAGVTAGTTAAANANVAGGPLGSAPLSNNNSNANLLLRSTTVSSRGDGPVVRKGSVPMAPHLFNHRKSSSISSIMSAPSFRNVNLGSLKRTLNLKEGEGERSSYVMHIRRSAGTAYNESQPGKWKLPIGILPIDKNANYALNNGRYIRLAGASQARSKKGSGVELKHGHLARRLLAAEVEDVDTSVPGMNSRLGRAGTTNQFHNTLKSTAAVIPEHSALTTTTTSTSVGGGSGSTGTTTAPDTANQSSASSIHGITRTTTGGGTSSLLNDEQSIVTGGDSGVSGRTRSLSSNSSGSISDANVAYYQHPGYNYGFDDDDDNDNDDYEDARANGYAGGADHDSDGYGGMETDREQSPQTPSLPPHVKPATTSTSLASSNYHTQVVDVDDDDELDDDGDDGIIHPANGHHHYTGDLGSGYQEDIYEDRPRLVLANPDYSDSD